MSSSSSSPDLDRTLLRLLLEEQVEKFRAGLENENPGLSPAERERYLRAVRLFCSQLLGAAPRTRGRKARPSSASGSASGTGSGSGSGD